MERDEQFDGFNHESLPEPDLDFSCKNGAKATQPEAVVDIWSREHCEWIRLPITKVETRINKDGPADLSTTSKVSVPVTWGLTPDAENKVPLYEYVGATTKNENPTFDLVRIFYWNKYTEKYSVEHFGYVASIGPASENGVFRFYVYDAADMMTNISVTKTYDGPTAAEVANFVAYDATYGLQENGPVPIRNVTTTAAAEMAEIEGAFETFDKRVAGWLGENTPIISANDVDTWEILGGAAGVISPAIEPLINLIDGNEEWLDNELGTGGHKHFSRNRDTLADVMNWLTEEIGGSWYFEPTNTGVVLVVNNGAAASDEFSIGRSAYYDGQFDFEGLEYIQGYNPAVVDVVSNTSLEDLKPINHLELNGESADSFLGVNTADPFGDILGPRGSAASFTDKYPHVEVSYPPLLERTGGKKLGPNPIDSGKTTLAESEKQAEKKFLEAHEDNTDGSIDIKALPTIRPYDYMAAVPVCNDTFDADMNPIQYEVNSVIHKVSAGEPYITHLGVSIALDESVLDITAFYKDIEADTSEEPSANDGDSVEDDTEYCDPPT